MILLVLIQLKLQQHLCTMTKAFSIVEFLGDNSVEIASKKWIVDSDSVSLKYFKHE
jgi:hypothetical protein